MYAAKKPNPFAKKDAMKGAPVGKAAAKSKKMKDDMMEEDDMTEDEDMPFTTSSVAVFGVYSSMMKAKRFKKKF